MKKIFSAIMVLVVLFNAAGYFIVYELDRYLIRKEMFSLIEHGCFTRSITILSIYDPSNDPSFKRTEKAEIEYHGNMYDVAREVRSGKIYTFYCVHDKQEDLLIAGMKSMHQNKNAVSLLQHFISIALPVVTERNLPQEFRQICYPPITERFHNRSLIPFYPPPELG
jgi:hypothetical protein